jgi:hypothetical protein
VSSGAPGLGSQAGLDRLDALLRDVGRAGLPVRLLYNGEMTTATTNGDGFTLAACLPQTGYLS